MSIDDPGQAARSRSWGAPLAVALILVDGIVGGVLWGFAYTAPEPEMIDGRPALGEVGLAQVYGAEGWYLLIALGLGLVAALSVRVVLRAARPQDLAVALIASCGAAMLMLLVGPATPVTAFGSADDAWVVPTALDVGAWLPLLAWPLGVSLGWSLDLWWPGNERVRVSESQDSSAVDPLPVAADERREDTGGSPTPAGSTTA